MKNQVDLEADFGGFENLHPEAFVKFVKMKKNLQAVPMIHTPNMKTTIDCVLKYSNSIDHSQSLDVFEEQRQGKEINSRRALHDESNVEMAGLKGAP